MDKLKVLMTELTEDPLARGYQALLLENKYDAVQTLLNSRSDTHKRAFNSNIPSYKLIQWISAEGRLMKFKRAAADETKTDAVRSIADGALALLQSGISLDMSDSSNSSMVQTLVTEGVLSEDDAIALAALAAQEGSRAEELGLVELGSDIGYGLVKEAHKHILAAA